MLLALQTEEYVFNDFTLRVVTRLEAASAAAMAVASTRRLDGEAVTRCSAAHGVERSGAVQ